MKRSFLTRFLSNRTGLGAASLTLVFSGAAAAGDVTPLIPLVSVQRSSLETAARRTDQTSLNRWKLSVAPVFASQALDVASSYGMQELNPVLAGSDGRFGAKGAGIKLAATGGLLGIE